MADAATPTRRSREKSDRRGQLLAAAEQLFAERGFTAVRLEDIGRAAGVSGPAIYRHFPNKEALLVALLGGVSDRLLDGARTVLSAGHDAATTLECLIDRHLDFVFAAPRIIEIQDRDLAHLPDTEHRRIRRAQRRYVEIWASTLRGLHSALTESDARLMAHAAFGLLNSTPHGVPSAQPRAADARHAREIMRAMTVAALTAPRC
ncbi:TetR family transcriptional regulator [Mycolicibacillus koreensis]|nr:TetR family transcriptional regulator [Mycolicibacillus koreensis]